jgi:hypothetical protein
MTKVKCILGYYDTQLNKSVAIGEEFEVADDRAKQLVKAKVATEVATPTTEKVVKAKKARAKKEA